MAGLDSIKRYAPGGTVDDSSTTVGTNDASAPNMPVGKAVTTKSPYSLPTSTAPVGVDDSILKRMEAMIAEREKQKGSWQESLKDAMAWWSGGMAGPSEALARRAAEREADEATTFGMRREIAQYQSQQALAKAAQADVYRALGYNPDGTPVTAGGARNPLVANIDPTFAAQIADLAKTDPVKAKQELLKHTAEMAKIASTARLNKDTYAKVIEIKTPKGLDYVSLAEYLANPNQYTLTEKGKSTADTIATSQVAPQEGVPLSTRQNNPGNLVDPATGKIRTFATPEEGAAALKQDISGKLSGQSQAVKNRFTENVGNFMSPAMLAEVWSPANAPGNSAQSTINYAKHIANKLGIDPTAQIPNTPEAAAKVQEAITEFEAGSYKPAPTVAPTATSVAPAATTPVAAPAAPTPAPASIPAAAQVPVAKTLSPGESIVAPAATAATAPVIPTVTTPAPAAQAPAAPTVAAATPTAPTKIQSSAAPAENVMELTIPQLRARAEAEKEGETARLKEQNILSEKQRPVFEARIDPIQLADDAAAFDRIKRLVVTDSNIAGVLAKPGYKNAVGTFLKEGITTPKGTLNFKGLEDAIFQSLKGTTGMSITRRQELASYLARMELNAAALIAGQGAISEGERTTLRSVSLSTSNTPEMIFKRAEMMERRNQLDKQIAAIYGDGTNVKNMAAFKLQIKDTPEFKQYEKDIKAIANKEYDFKKPGGKPVLPNPPEIQAILDKQKAQQ